MNSRSREAYLQSMTSSAESEYEKEQQRIQTKRMVKQQIVDHRNIALFGSQEEKYQLEKNRKEQLEIQQEINREIKLKEKEQSKLNTGVDSITNMQKESYIDNIYRNELARKIQQENQMLANERLVREQNEKRINQTYNADNYINSAQRNQYLF